MNMKKLYLVGGFALFCVLIVSAFLLLNRPGKTHIITLTEDGFVPATITIKRNDIITFKTTRNKPFWPASNIHPTHGIYPEFDPLDAIMPDKTWSFKFGKVGKWAFHDHLAPYFVGKITVTP